MTQLTKEHFDHQVGKLAAKKDLDELALITKRGFDSVDGQLKDIRKELDLRKDVEQLKLEMKDIRQTLALDKTKQ